jgi:hypothetical protein
MTGACYDAGIVQIQIDGGPWETIVPNGGYPYLIREGSGHPFEGDSGYSGNFPYWREARFDLSGFSGMARIQFRFGSDQGVGREGWYVDDIALQRSPQPDIHLDPWEFQMTLSPGESDSEPLSVYNVGTEPLTFEIETQIDSARISGMTKAGSEVRSDWLDVNPSAGQVEPDSLEIVDVTVDATDLEEGRYFGRLSVNSNDPDENWLVVPVELLVSPVLCGDADSSGETTVADAYCILNFLGAGPEPVSCWAANVNGDDKLTPSDGFCLFNYLGGVRQLDCQPCEYIRDLIPIHYHSKESKFKSAFNNHGVRIRSSGSSSD